MSGAAPAPRNRHLWWALSPAYTVGVIAFIPVVHAAIKLRRRDLWYWAAGLVVGDIVVWSLFGSDSSSTATSSASENVGTVLALVLAVIGTVQALGLRHKIFADAGPAQGLAPGVDPAVAGALAARQRRQEALRLVARDPGLARDLRIGRPDLQRQYDDGGLVDVNHVPASILVSHLGFTPAQAQGVVDARDQVGRFESANDMSNLAEVPPATVDGVRDRIAAL